MHVQWAGVVPFDIRTYRGELKLATTLEQKVCAVSNIRFFLLPRFLCIGTSLIPFCRPYHSKME